MLMSMCLPKFEIYQKLKPTQILDDLIFFKKKFCLMSGLKFTLSDGIKKIIFRLDLFVLGRNFLTLLMTYVALLEIFRRSLN